jgi:hypothetical protein
MLPTRGVEQTPIGLKTLSIRAAGRAKIHGVCVRVRYTLDRLRVFNYN